MQFVFFDTETSSRSATFGQMLEFSAIKCDEELEKTDDTISVCCRLRPHILPELGALLITNKTIEEINKRDLSHYQMILKVLDYSRRCTPSTWIGWNTIEFDFKWLRQAFYQTLQQPYFHQFFGNRRADALTIARTGYILSKNRLNVSLSKRGRPSFKLEELAKANHIIHTEAHTALSDVEATIAVSKLVYRKDELLWKQALTSSSKEDTEAMLWSNPLFVSTESVFGVTTARVMTAICHHPVYKYTMALDLEKDPETYIYEEGEALRKSLRRSPKVLRTIRTSNHPMILPINYKDRIPKYKNISLDTLMDRVKVIQKDTNFKTRVSKLLLAEYEMEQSSLGNREKETEEKIHEGYLLPLGEEDTLVKLFEGLEKWEDKYELAKGFRESRLRELAMRLIYEESPTTLPSRDQKEIKEYMLGRLNSTEDVPWNTFKKAEESIKEHESTEKSSREKEIVESYKNYVGLLKRV
jgi:exodeoxyribonuclease-1